MCIYGAKPRKRGPQAVYSMCRSLDLCGLTFKVSRPRPSSNSLANTAAERMGSSLAELRYVIVTNPNGGAPRSSHHDVVGRGST